MASSTAFGALLLDGTTDYVSISHHADFNFGLITSWSIDVSFKTDAAGMILHKFASSVGFKIETLANATVQVTLNTTTLSGGSTLLDSSWHQVRFCMDRDTGVSYLFIDGNQVDRADTSSLVSVDTAETLYWGHDGSSDFFDGSIAELRISNKCRSNESYTADAAQYFDDIFCLGLYHLNEGQGTIAFDMAANNVHETAKTRHDMTITGSPTWANSDLEWSPTSIWREHIWQALDAYTKLTTWMSSRSGQKFRMRVGDPNPSQDQFLNAPGLFVAPGIQGVTRAETTSYYTQEIVMTVQGFLQGEDQMDQMEKLAFLVQRAVWNKFRGDTGGGGRFNHKMIQNLEQRGPQFSVLRGEQVPENPLFSNFRTFFVAQFRVDLRQD